MLYGCLENKRAYKKDVPFWLIIPHKMLEIWSNIQGQNFTESSGAVGTEDVLILRDMWAVSIWLVSVVSFFAGCSIVDHLFMTSLMIPLKIATKNWPGKVRYDNQRGTTRQVILLFLLIFWQDIRWTVSSGRLLKFHQLKDHLLFQNLLTLM